MSQDESQDHLDPRHIKLVRLERQAIYRSRTYRLIFGIACLGAAAQLIYLAIGKYQTDRYLTTGSMLAAVMILIACAVILLKRAHELHLQARKSQLKETTGSPDFSTLSDGSQFADRLSAMTGFAAQEEIELDPHILNQALNLAMDWGADFMKPTQARLKNLHPHLTDHQLDAYDAEAQAAMKLGHSIAGGDFSAFKRAVRDQFPWVSTDNLHRMHSQGEYFANK